MERSLIRSDGQVVSVEFWYGVVWRLNALRESMMTAS
jgi:hypothetical protein